MKIKILFGKIAVLSNAAVAELNFMFNKKIIISLSCLLLLICCNSQKVKLNIETETIDFWSFKKMEGRIPENSIKNKKYILLDNSSDDILFKGIEKILIRNNRVYILDMRLNKLIVFDMEGRAIGRVGQRGQGPEEYLQISDFDVNDNGDIYFIDGTANADRLFEFNKNLKFISKKNMPFEADIIRCLSNGKLLFGLSTWNKGDNANMRFAITDTEMKTEQSFMEYDKYFDESWFYEYTFVETEYGILYNKPIDNYVYQFSGTGSLNKAYYFDFGSKNVPDDDKKDIDGNRVKYENYCYLKHFTVINDNYILGTLQDGLKKKPFIIVRKDRELYIGEEVASGDLSCITGFYDNKFISYIYPGKYENIQNMDLPDSVKQYVEDENFVLCINELEQE
jgi:hypothetical protein